MITVEVSRKEAAAEDVYLFELRDPNGGALPPFTAGAHIDVEVQPGLTRQYSLCNTPGGDRFYQIGVLREPNSRGGSAGMVDQVAVGTRLKISSPRNHFPLAPDGRGARLLAGGIGITPILAMARQLWTDGVAFKLWYAGRSAERMAFRRDITRSPFAHQAVLHADDQAGAPLDLTLALASPQAGEHIYVCGPTGFIEAVIAASKSAGWTDDVIHREHFATASVPSPTGERPFTLRLARSGRDLVVPADRSVLDVLLEHGVVVDWSCEQGVCGSCTTRVLAGEPDHRDLFMTDAEHAAMDQFTPCCSRSLSPVLVVDL